MDILVRLRLTFWLMVLGLWGLVSFQFLKGDSTDTSMHWLPNSWLSGHDEEPMTGAAMIAQPARVFPPHPLQDTEVKESFPPQSFTPAKISLAPERPPPITHKIEPQPTPKIALAKPSLLVKVSFAPAETPVTTPLPARQILPSRPARPFTEPISPSGFIQVKTRHFLVYAEGKSPPDRFLQRLEDLHSNLMLDLEAFSPWARDQRVSIFLFRDQKHYRQVTGRPEWSGGASSVKRRKIYLYESPELPGILAHELCHIYFDSFFSGSREPLWLSEGMATMAQTERGLAAPTWLKENLQLISRGGGYALEDLVSVDNTRDANDEEIRLWYTQAYSVVRFLTRYRYHSSFFRFCRSLREDYPMSESLYRAYGMPLNRVQALEYVWRYDLETHRL